MILSSRSKMAVQALRRMCTAVLSGGSLTGGHEALDPRGRSRAMEYKPTRRRDMEDKPKYTLISVLRKSTRPRRLPGARRLPGLQPLLLVIAMLATALAVLAPVASANAPNPTSTSVERYEPLAGGKVKVTVSGTWTWQNSLEVKNGVPSGNQNDCNDSRIGVGYAVDWGDNTANPLKEEGGAGEVYVGDAEDNWVHSVTTGEENVAGPFKGHGGANFTVNEMMFGETPEALTYAFGDEQGISSTDKGTRAVPDKADAEHWYSNCGPSAQETVTTGSGEHIVIGNSKDASGHASEKELEEGYPNGRWGPISHVYASTAAVPFKICPVFYDPHGKGVGENAGGVGEIIAGGAGHNGDNSVEKNGNGAEICATGPAVPKLTTSSSPKVSTSGKPVSDSATIEGSSPEGKLTWELFGPFKSSGEIKPSSCEAPAVAKFGPFEKTVVAGTKTYTVPTEPTLTEPGVYQWVASFTSSNTSKNISLPFVGCGETVEQVEVAAEPSFTIEKEQKIEGEAGYTKNELSTTVGKNVDYKIIVKNTGNTELTFNPLTDSKCESISSSTTEKIPVGGEKTYTCEHKHLAVGTYTNTATISDTLQEKTSNEVKVNVPAEPAFTIEKEQKLTEGGTFTKSKLTGKVGETIFYKIVVTNTGNVPLTLSNFTDTGCESITGGPGATPVAVNESTTFNCKHKLTTADIEPAVHLNNAKVTGAYEGNETTHTSNTVEANAKAEPAFTIEKEQKLTEGGTFTKSKLTGKVGETIFYKIVVTNTGNVPLTLSNFTDTGCESITGGPGATPVAVNESTTFNCKHKLTTADIEPAVHLNNAKVTGAYEGNETTHTSNTVEANAKAEPAFTIEKEQKLTEGGTFTKSKLTGKVGETIFYKIVVTNTGNVPLTLSNFTDTGCESITGGPGATPVAVNESTTFTCKHKLTTADIEPAVHLNNAKVTGAYEGNETTHTSNTVEANAKAEPAFTIEKEQKLTEGGTFTKSKLTGKVGETIFYKIVVTNTGNVPLTLSNFTDTGCESITGGPGATPVAVNESTTFNCKHKLTTADIEPAVHLNNAKVTGAYEGNETTHTSNTVEANAKAEPAFTIEKEQKLTEGGTFTKSKLTGTVGETIFYKIVVTNTGNVPLTLSNFTDTGCESITGGPGATPVAVNESTTFTCKHKLTTADIEPAVHLNNAKVTGAYEGNETTHTSNTVEANAKAEPAFTIEKEQKLTEGGTFTKSKLTGKVGETIFYKIVVTNTGNVPLTLSNFTDTGCESITGGPGATPVAVNESTTFTCKHKLTTADIEPAVHLNNAKVTGAYEGNETTHTSNTVEANAKAEPAFTIEKEQKLTEGGTFTKSKLTGTVGETIFYKIVVTNTGNVPLTLSNFTDTGCESITGGPGATPVAVNESTTFTCKHKLTTADIEPAVHLNNAKVTGAYEGNETTHTSNTVEANAKAEPAFTIEKEQKLTEGGTFTKSKLTGKVGETIFYKIVVTNTGNVPLTLSNFTDTGCESITGGPGATPVAVNESTTFNCKHKLTTADIEPAVHLNNAKVTGAYEGNETTHTSNTVEANAKAEPAFTIEKEQKLEGEASFTKNLLKAKVGQTILYKITVTNTGNTELSLGPLSDPKCENIAPSGAVKVPVGGTQVYTCEHKNLALGTYVNVATVANNTETPKESNKVEVEVPAEPGFTIEKEQKIEGEANYTKNLLKAKVGQTVDYKITVKNTGNTELSLGPLSDPKCENIVPSGAVKVPVGGTQVYTCEHKNLAVGTYVNVAAISNNGEPPKESPKVEVEVPAEPAFTIEKEQKIEGEAAYTKSLLKAKVGQTVDYKITVKNTGNTELSLGPLSDAHCENIAPSGAVKVPVGGTQVYTCEHKNLALGLYYNVATVSNNGEPPKESPKVEVEVPGEPNFTIEKEQKLEGEANYTKSLLKAKVGQTVDYKITVKNTGNTELSLGPLSDSHCENIAPSGTVKVPVGGTQVYTCEHKNLALGAYYNVATVANNGEPPKESPKVEVEVPGEPNFTIEKEQKLGGEANYTKSKLTAKVGDTVSYKIVVKNTGNTELTLGPLSDSKCENIVPSGSVKLAVGASQTYTCEHKDSCGRHGLHECRDDRQRRRNAQAVQRGRSRNTRSQGRSRMHALVPRDPAVWRRRRTQQALQGVDRLARDREDHLLHRRQEVQDPEELAGQAPQVHDYDRPEALQLWGA